jgi:hypothetical protein
MQTNCFTIVIVSARSTLFRFWRPRSIKYTSKLHNVREKILHGCTQSAGATLYQKKPVLFGLQWDCPMLWALKIITKKCCVLVNGVCATNVRRLVLQLLHLFLWPTLYFGRIHKNRLSNLPRIFSFVRCTTSATFSKQITKDSANYRKYCQHGHLVY